MTLSEAIEQVEAMTTSNETLLDGWAAEAGVADALVERMRIRCQALRRVLEAAKRIEPHCSAHTGDVRCRGCYEL